MAYDDEKSSKPREMVHRAQASVANALHRLRLAHQEVRHTDERDELAREFHSAVLLYWEQIKRFSSEERIAELWHQQGVVKLSGYDDPQPLQRLAEYRLRSETHREEVPDPESGGTTVRQVSEAWHLSPRQALAVYDQLDRCANELGFDARPTRQAAETGAGAETEGDDGLEDMDHLNSGVQV